jgi:uncharacterized protein YbaP (TraB family)
MKNCLLFLFLITTLVKFPASAQNLEKTLLWKIYGNGSKDTSFLYGTIHVIEKKDFFISRKTKKCFKATEALVMEINLDIDPEVMMLASKSQRYPDEKTIKDYLSPSDYKFFRNYLQDSLKMNYIQMNSCEVLRPFYVKSLLESRGFKWVVSYEKKFHAMAKKKEKIGLESAQEHIRIYAHGDIQKQVNNLIKKLKSGEKDTLNTLDYMVQIYKTQDIQKLYELTVQTMNTEEGNIFDVSIEDLLDNRNIRMIPKLKALMKSKSIFIAVGAAHLAGENGLIQLLRNQGYTVSPVLD